MFDDPGDIDRNGIPDSIQRDPVMVPEPGVFFGATAGPGLPGIDPPIEATADAPTEPFPEPPVAPTPPPDGADEAALADHERAMADYQHAMQQYNQTMQMLTNVGNMKHESLKGIAQNLRG